jgi:hypothetical protein
MAEASIWVPEVSRGTDRESEPHLLEERGDSIFAGVPGRRGLTSGTLVRPPPAKFRWAIRSRYPLYPAMPELPCPDCSHAIPSAAVRCPHCARPGLFPNVREVEQPEDVKALNDRFKAAQEEAATRDTTQALAAFIKAVEGSKAVLARSLNETQRLACSDKQGYATYYQLTNAEVRVPDGDAWDLLRRPTDAALFPGYADDMRFAALSLSPVGLSNYGDCSITLLTTMIAHRATLLEENSVLFMKHHGIALAEELAPKLRGHRSSWIARAKLGAAKLGSRVEPKMPNDQFHDLLLKQGAKSDDDIFIEVHIWGPMTVRTFEHVTVTSTNGRLPTKTILRALKAALAKYGVTCTEAA